MSRKQMETKKRAKGGGSKYVYETLKREILSLALKPGTPLDETGLSERFSMSRSPVREALVRLSAEGLVVMLSNRSTLVAPINLTEFPRYVEALDFLQRINTRLAAQNRSDSEIELMKKEAEAFDQACVANDYLAMSASNRDFHMTIAQAGKNPYLARAYGQLLDEGRRILHMHFDYIQSSATDTLLGSEHEDMITAIRDRDIARADHLAHEHTRQFHKRFVDFLSAQYNEDFDFAVSTLT
ncbi:MULTISPECIES: GntR family transcriptional regulator [unclassified Ruegeria]|uniref:GntR family transcriptional regulator n=1 Tax=unclassified Ruegeria TaxID=2625375 RepID=UPI00148A11AF|nr:MULTISPECIES: GntR family transcriptional regulator [unclassified Ruegeria]NOD77559.1 FCD domain-containing protein [Ruegeria sp. HKCCD4332]NOD89764.1 FCD domain-containing protein [Ruegeria sp. HKCCD4318]NOE14790.1 FCD domain-containing protein [Ruegeria sp. HKCCD4318-2]NOG11608.1 GntR family transcriptional regulator [Ruegeria sp. HKCCD4315]